jgi:hypothetical protein
MANETIVLNQSNLFISVAKTRMTALPTTGTILSIERLAPTASLTPGLHKTGAFIINSGTGYRATLNVLMGSQDDKFLSAMIRAIEATSLLADFVVTYDDTTYVSGGVAVESEPTRNFNADNLEYISYPLLGMFQIVKVGSFASPGPLTADQINSFA